MVREPGAIARMADAGSRRIREGGNTYDDRWDTILDALA